MKIKYEHFERERMKGREVEVDGEVEVELVLLQIWQKVQKNEQK